MDVVDEYGEGYGQPHKSGFLEALVNPISRGITGILTKNRPTLEQSVPNMEDIANKEQKELWEREDAIRKETQGREDTAYQRSMADMRKAGINPNLQNVSGAQSGGGISGATAKNLDRIENQKDRELDKLIQKLQQNWQGNQNDLDRITKLLSVGISNIE